MLRISSLSRVLFHVHGSSRLFPTVLATAKKYGTSDSLTLNYLAFSDEDLLQDCRVDTFRASGPGGQHRNKTESAVRLKHLPTGIVSQAVEDRSQHRNKDSAVQRLRYTMAIKIRNPVDLENYEMRPELRRILPVAYNKKQQIGPNHPEYPRGMQCLLDLIEAVGGSISDAGQKLGLSTGAMSKVITADNALLRAVNDIRASKGLKPLKA